MLTREEILEGMPYPIFIARCSIDFKFFAEKCLRETSSGDPIYIMDFQMKWIDAVESSKRVIIESGTGSSKCLPADARVKTTNGFKTIKEIQPGDKVYSLDDKYKLVKDTVIGKCNNGVKDIYEITLRNGKSVRCTSNHPVRTAFGWKTIDEGLSVGERIATTRILENETIDYLSDHEIKILAYLIAEGALSSGTYIKFSNLDQKVVDDMNDALYSYNKTTMTNYRDGDYGVKGCLPLLRKYNLMGTCSKTKFVPDIIFRLSKDKIRLFLNRLWEGDGFFSSTEKSSYPKIGYASSSLRLAKDVQLLLEYFGIPSKVCKEINTQHGYDIPSYNVTIETREGLLTFIKEIGTFNKHERMNACLKKLKSLKSNPNTDLVPIDYILSRSNLRKGVLERAHRFFLNKSRNMGRDKLKRLYEITKVEEYKHLAESDVFWDPIVNIEKVGKEETWDIEVENNHNFIADGIITHNSELMGAMYLVWKVFKSKNINVLLLSKTRDQSTSNLLSRVKRYIENNEILTNMLVPANRSKTWNAEEMQTKNDCLIKNVTYSDTIRGFRAHIIVADEIDSYDDPNIFFEHVLSRLHPTAQLIGISTPVGPTKIIGQLKERDQAGILKGRWKFVKTPYLVDDEGKPAKIERREDIWKYRSIWPENWSLEILYERWGEQGKANWLRNYMCESIGEIDDAIFPIKYIEKAFDYKLGFSKNTHEDAMYFIGVDLAISEGARADHDAYVVVEKRNGQYVIKWIQTEHGIDTIPKMDIIQSLYETYYSDKGTYIIVDKSLIGIDVIRGLQARGIPVEEGSFHSIARKILYTTLSNVLASGRLLIPRDPSADDECIKYSQELLEQLTGFRRAVSQKSRNETIESRARHDDIAAALALAVTEAVKYEDFDNSPLLGN